VIRLVHRASGTTLTIGARVDRRARRVDALLSAAICELAAATGRPADEVTVLDALRRGVSLGEREVSS